MSDIFDYFPNLHCSFLNQLHWHLLLEWYHHFSVSNLDIIDCNYLFDYLLLDHWHISLYDNLDWNTSLNFNFLNDFTLFLHNDDLLSVNHLHNSLLHWVRGVFWNNLLYLSLHVDGDWLLDLHNFKHLDLSLHYLLNNVWHMHNILDNSWNNHYLLHNFLDFHHSRHLNQFLNHFFYQYTNLFNNFFFKYNWHRNLTNHFDWHLFLVWNHLLNLHCHNFWFILDVWYIDLDDDWFFLSEPNWNSLLNLDISQLQNLTDYRLLHYPFNFQNDLLSIWLDSHNDFLFIWHRHFLNYRHFSIHHNLY